MFGAFLAAVVLATVPGPRVTVVPPDQAAGSRVAVVGATRAEERSARRAVAASGAASPVRGIVFSDHGKNRQIVVKTAGRGSGADWLSRLVASDIVGSAHARGETIDWVEIRGRRFGDGSAVEPYALHRRSREELRAVGETIARRAAQHMHHVTEIEAFQVAGGGVKVVLRLSQGELLRGENTCWLDDLIPKGRFEHLLIVLGPGGIPVGGGGSYGHGSGGFWAFGSTPPDDQRARPSNGPIHLRFHVVRSFPKAQRFDVRLDCSGAREGARCSAFRDDWVRLLPPVSEGVVCSQPAGIDSLEVQGTVDGIPVDRLYDGCYGWTTLRWERILGIPSRSA